jgi:large subunit ribosomal protein L18
MVQGTEGRPRLSVYRSNAHIYAQIICDGRMDESARTLFAVSSLDASIREDLTGKNKVEVAKAVGKAIASKCKENGIGQVVFDRNGFLYHGRVAALAEGAREAELKF